MNSPVRRLPAKTGFSLPQFHDPPTPAVIFEETTAVSFMALLLEVLLFLQNPVSFVHTQSGVATSGLHLRTKSGVVHHGRAS